MNLSSPSFRRGLEGRFDGSRWGCRGSHVILGRRGGIESPTSRWTFLLNSNGFDEVSGALHGEQLAALGPVNTHRETERGQLTRKKRMTPRISRATRGVMP